jgi:Protein of unknown function (DUF3386)
MDAREIMRLAYENRYTWDSDFPGYSADVTYNDGETTYNGKAKVSAKLSVELDGIDDETIKKAILGQMQEVAIHRVRRKFEDVHAKNEFTLGETLEDGTIELLIAPKEGKTSSDRYQVRNNEVCMVHRHIHNIVVTIFTFSSHDTGEGYLSHRYDSIYHDPQTGEQKSPKSDFEDLYEKVGNYQLLTSRRITTDDNGQPRTVEFGFANVALLEPALVTA